MSEELIDLRQLFVTKLRTGEHGDVREVVAQCSLDGPPRGIELTRLRLHEDGRAVFAVRSLHTSRASRP